ncbi:endophilin-A3-like [Cyprinodon tularosa]|uniref:endophilin-A3-like n=1 Tax=Cyprinodon tularosa TaxID=77115 RepID=UPI0018E20E3F|nr:endophilin-A3-like [Cyprinodon tularosa]
MSVSGMKKQLHKASQLLNERLMGAEGTKLDEDFLKMEKTIAVINLLLAELLSRTTEFLQPNPGTGSMERPDQHPAHRPTNI